MPLQEIYYIAEMVVGLAVIISIIFVAIELRQNTYIVRKSMADRREQRVSWLFETLCTDNDFREFHRRIDSDWDQFDESEKYRAHCLGVRSISSMLNELVAYFDGQISQTEYRSLRWNMQNAKKRPNFDSAYQLLKNSYPLEVQQYWENLETSDDIYGSQKSFKET